MLKITRLHDALTEVFFFLTAIKPSRRSIIAAKTREKEKKERRKKNSKNRNFDFCVCPSHNALKRDVGGKKGKLLCCKRILKRIKDNLAQIQPKNHQNVQKTPFLQTSFRSQLKITSIVRGVIMAYPHSCLEDWSVSRL